MQNTLKIQQFLRFRKQNPNWLAQIKKQRKEEETQQKQISKLINRNNLKKKQLQSAKKQYEKLKSNTEQILYRMKTEQDALDQQIQSLQKKKMDDFRKTVVVEQKIQHIKQQIQNLKSEITSKQKSDGQIIRNLQNEITKYKKMVEDVEQRVSVHQQWLSHKQSNRSSFQPINISEIQSDLQNLKKSNQATIKQINYEQKRLKKQSQQVRKSYKEYCQKIDDKIKGWVKKCDSVLDQKKDIKVLLQGIDENVPLQQIDHIQLFYKTQLGSLASLYQPQSLKELGDFFVPYSIKMQGTGIQKLSDKNGGNNQNQEKKLGEMTEELTKSKQELFECENYIESLKLRIQKYNKDIDETKQSISYKKKK